MGSNGSLKAASGPQYAELTDVILDICEYLDRSIALLT